jgi:RNA polymerase sigma-70 factor (ECF subfamily)
MVIIMANGEFDLEEYREYLHLLGRSQLIGQMEAKVDISGVVQTTLFEAYQQKPTWESLDPEARAAWLRRIFANNLGDEVRRFRTKARDVSRERSLEQALDRSAARLGQWLLSQQTSPSQQAVRHEDAIRLANAIAALLPSQRRAIELHYLQGLPLAEIAVRLETTVGAVAALIYRGTRKLRALLSHD